MRSQITKQKIDSNQKQLNQYNDFINSIKLLQETKDQGKAIDLLLEIQRLEYQGRVDRGQTEQSALKKEYMNYFESDSAEANFKIESSMISIARFIGKEPINITSKIQPLIDEYVANKKGMSQERRNEIYFELKGHYEFLTKKVK